MMVMLYGEVMPKQLEALEKSGKFISSCKVDGDNFQAVCKELNGKKNIRLINRHENDYTEQFPEIVAGLGVKANCILNGEIAYWNEEKQIYDFNIFRGRQGLQNILEIKRRRLMFPCKFYVFDLISYEGESMVNNPAFPFERRYRILKQIINDNNTTELLPIRQDLKQHFKEECEAGREGIVIKNINNIYCNERTRTAFKIKNWQYELVRFNGFEENQNDTITLTNGNDRVLCPSQKHIEEIRATIMQLGWTEEVVRHLQDRSKESGKCREPSWKPKEKYIKLCNTTSSKKNEIIQQGGLK